MSVTRPGSAVEREHQRAYTNQNQEYCSGWQTWECDRGDEDDLETYLWATAWTFNGHVMVTKAVTVLPQGEEGLAIVRAAYGTFYNPATHPVGTATISIRTSSTKVNALAVPLSGQPGWQQTEGKMLPTEPGEADGFYYDWDQSSGPLKTLRHGSVVTVHTAYYRGGVNWNMIFGAHDKVNALALPNLGNAAAGTMMLIGAAVPVYYVLGSAYDIVPINYLMQYDEDKWSQAAVYARKYRRTVMGLPMVKTLNANGTIKDYYDNYGEECTDVANARKVPTTVNRAIGNPIPCKGKVKLDSSTFLHLQGLVTWM